MSLRFSPTGVAVYGTGTVAVDGSTPAALTGTVGPAAWKSTGVLVYQDGGTGSGPWTLKQLTLPATIVNIDSSPASLVAGGGGEWAAWEPATGLRSSIAIGPFSSSLLGDVSPDGELVRIEYAASRSGLIVYDSSGGILYQDSAVQLQSEKVCLRDSILSYYDATGWHLVDLNTSTTPVWLPRTDGVTQLVPITHRGTLYVLEKSNVITLRQANLSKAWILSSDPNAFPLDGVSINANTIMAGTCNVPSETPASLVVFRCTVTKAATISVETGTIVAGAIVYGSAQSVSTSPFTTGKPEGDSLTPPNPDLPFNHPVVEFDKKRNGYFMTQPWQKSLQASGVNAGVASAVLQNFPTPNLTDNGYDKIASSGQPTMMALPGQTTLNMESTDGTILNTLNPSTNVADQAVHHANNQWIPLVDGSEPPNFITDGAGHLILVSYP